MTSLHKSVLLKESIELLDVVKGTYVDATLGGGGHTLEIGRRLKAQGGKVISFDVDEEAIERFGKLLKQKGWNRKGKFFTKGGVEIGLVRENFANLTKELERLEISKVNGIIADLGMSSDQLEDASRGFSYLKDGPLDMRMDKSLKVTASDLVNGLYEKELIRLFQKSDERYARRIAKAIVSARKGRPIKTTLHLKQIIQKALPFEQEGRKHRSTSKMSGMIKVNRPSVCQSLRRNSKAYWKKPAMRVFQALRIAVNSELSSLQILLPQALEALAAGSCFVVITFHSGEDRIVKNFFREQERLERIEILTKKPVVPSEKELKVNLRARSAKLRAFKKI
jgi:16S rRNA (cytosine1402-N4)-methyltransferase